MNVLFVNSNREWGGGEVWLTHIAAELSQRGHRVTIVCRPASALCTKLGGKSEVVTPLRLSGDFNPVTVIRLVSILLKRRINLICVHTEKELRVAGIAGAIARVPVVISQDVDFPIKNSALNRFFYGKLAASIMVNSYATRNTLLSAAPWLQTQRVHVVWKGIEISRYRTAGKSDIRTEYHLSTDDCLVGFVGRLDEQKGIPTLLQAVRLAVVTNPHIRLLIAGEGNLEEYIREYSSQHDLDRNIFLMGFVRDVPSFLKGVDFVVVPSYWEGFCYSALEAMMAGRMVVGSNTSSIPELVVHNSTGILVPPRSPEDLAGAMIHMCNEPHLREEMGARGRDRAERLFPARVMYDKTEEFFCSAVATFRNRPAPKNVTISSVTDENSTLVRGLVKDDSFHLSR